MRSNGQRDRSLGHATVGSRLGAGFSVRQETTCQAVIRLQVRVGPSPRRGATGDQAWSLVVLINDQQS